MKLFLLFLIIFFLAFQCCDQKHDISEEEWYLETNDKGIRLYVKEFGIGDTLLIVHGGFGAEHSYLLDPLENLSKKYHLVFYDQRGSLRSPCPDSLITIYKHIEDIEKLREELKLRKLNFVAHSAGGFIAMLYLEKYPQNVKGLILISPVFPKTPTTEKEKEIFAYTQQKIKEFLERPEINKKIEEEGLNKEKLTSKEKTYRWRIKFAGSNIYNLNRWRRIKGGQVFYNQKAGTAAGRSMPNKWNFVDDIEGHKFPVTIILGDHDIVDYNGKLFHLFFNGIKNVEIKLIKDAGHNSWIDQPEEFQKILIDALEKK